MLMDRIRVTQSMVKVQRPRPGYQGLLRADLWAGLKVEVDVAFGHNATLAERSASHEK